MHWTSGIEVGTRLISLAWIRRLLDGWPGVAGLFEDDGLAVQQIRWHQRYLDGFKSRGSSANNHVIAEAAGQLVASCAFPWFGESERWRRTSAALLERELLRNTFPSGIGRELASDYQSFVAELGLLAAVEAGAAGHPVSAAVWQRLCAMTDSAAALVDERMRAPRQGDGDDGRAVLLDAPVPGGGWPSLMALGDALFGRLGWWPQVTAGVASTLIGALAGGPRDIPGRPGQRPSRFPDAGVTLLRTDGAPAPEIWCRLDGGPHGFLSIAAHAHADAMSVPPPAGRRSRRYLSLRPPPATAARSGWTERRAVLRSSTRSTAANTPSGLPSTWDPRSRRSSMAAARSCAGTPRPPPGKHGWSCRRGCSGACTVARPIPSSAGTRPVWESGCPRSRFSAPVGLPRARLSPPGWSSSTGGKRKNRCLPGQLYTAGRAFCRESHAGNLSGGW